MVKFGLLLFYFRPSGFYLFGLPDPPLVEAARLFVWEAGLSSKQALLFTRSFSLPGWAIGPKPVGQNDVFTIGVMLP